LLLLLQGKKVLRVLKTQQQTLRDSSIQIICIPSKTMIFIWSHNSYNRESLQKHTTWVTDKACSESYWQCFLRWPRASTPEPWRRREKHGHRADPARGTSPVCLRCCGSTCCLRFHPVQGRYSLTTWMNEWKNSLFPCAQVNMHMVDMN
jgi:hypothetical protein